MPEVMLNRRRFLVSSATFAGGLAVGIALPGSRIVAGPGEPATHFSAWLSIAPDDTVTVRVPTGEFGTGSFTQVAMNVAEELACDWSQVKAEYASARQDYLEKGPFAVGRYPFFTGHGTDHARMQYALQLGASTRERLRVAAAEQWQVAALEVEARDSILTHTPTGRTLRYGQVAARAAGVALPEEPALKPEVEWTLLGKVSPAKLQTSAMLDGSAQYGIDVKVPGMVYAALLQCPVHGGTLDSYDASAVLKMPGVRAVVAVDSGFTRGSPVPAEATFGLSETASQSAVAVIADHYWQARTALDKLPVQWVAGAGEQLASERQVYETASNIARQSPQSLLRDEGDVEGASGKLAISAEYLTPYCDQAPVEPLNATALVTADRVDVWAPCQDSQQAYWVAIDETGAAPENVHIHRTLVGGGFGRRSLSDEVRMAVAVARKYPGTPVKTIWSREEMTRQGRYRTLVAGRYSALLGEDGMPLSWDAHAAMAGNPLVSLPLGFSDVPYLATGLIPNVRAGVSHVPSHVLSGAYRGPCYNSHAFMVETFVDECAVAAGIDPLEYRLKLLGDWDISINRCLEVAASKAGWGRSLPRGQGLGIAVSNWPNAGMKEAGSTICAVAHVEVSKAGELHIHSLDVSFDCGRYANRDALLAQLEGGIIFGLSMSLNEEITLRNGVVVEGNFHEYQVLRMADIPGNIRIHFEALSGHERFAMIGEAPVGPIGPAIGNAIYQATGKRLRSTPFRQHDLAWS